MRTSDTMRGNAGNDDLFGGPGNDTIYGGRGDDLTEGKRHGDILYGGPGNDTIIAGTGFRHDIYARDGEKDLICVDRRGSGSLQLDREDRFIFNKSC